jgi:hypothetical protein
MRVVSALLCAALLLSLACATAPLRLERYRAAYSTHFEGIPDQAEACALVRNTSPQTITWVELRMRATSRFAGSERVQKSGWVYRGRIEPGAVVALRFVHPPVADEIEVRLARAGAGGPGPHEGRPVLASEDCSDEGLRVVLSRELSGHTAPDIELHAAARATPDLAGDGLVAEP